MPFWQLKTQTPKPKMSYDFLVSKGKATDKMIYDRGSWATVQIGVDFGLPGNTGSINQKLTELGYREGKPGDILLVFYNAEDDIFVYFRGACANPQTLRPVPVLDAPTPTTKAPTPTTNPTPTPTPTLAPKDPSKDSAAKGNAPVGSGVNQDPGPGNYVAPTAAPTPPVESRVNPTPPAPTVPTATPTAATTAAPATTPTPTPVDVAVGDPTSVGTPAIPN